MSAVPLGDKTRDAGYVSITTWRHKRKRHKPTQMLIRVSKLIPVAKQMLAVMAEITAQTGPVNSIDQPTPRIKTWLSLTNMPAKTPKTPTASPTQIHKISAKMP
jgi:hypothetical protein